MVFKRLWFKCSIAMSTGLFRKKEKVWLAIVAIQCVSRKMQVHYIRSCKRVIIFKVLRITLFFVCKKSH